MTVSKEQAPTRETLASLLAALHYGQYSTNEDEKSLRRNIERALKNYDIGAGQFIEQSQDSGQPAVKMFPEPRPGETFKVSYEDSGHAAAPTDEQIIAEAKKQGLWLVTGMDNDHEPFTTNVGLQVIRTVHAFLAAPAPTQQPTDEQVERALKAFSTWSDTATSRDRIRWALTAALSGAAPTPQPELTDERVLSLIKPAMKYYGYDPEYAALTNGAGFFNLVRAVEREVRSLLGAAPTQAPQQLNRDGEQE